MSCFVSFWALPIFFYNFIKNKISQCLNGVYVKGSSEVWQWSRLSCIHFSEKHITWCCYRVYVKGNRSPKKLHRIQNAEGSMISALSWGPPFLEPKNITNQQFYKETFVQKKEVVFCFFSCGAKTGKLDNTLPLGLGCMLMMLSESRSMVNTAKNH